MEMRDSIAETGGGALSPAVQMCEQIQDVENGWTLAWDFIPSQMPWKTNVIVNKSCPVGATWLDSGSEKKNKILWK